MNRHVFTDADRERSRESHRRNDKALARHNSARRAALARWYRPLGSHDERIDTHLQILAKHLRLAVEKNDLETILRVQTVMARFEQMRINLDKGPKMAEAVTEVDDGVANAVQAFKSGRRTEDETVIDVTPKDEK